MLIDEGPLQPAPADARVAITDRQSITALVSRNELFAGLAVVGYANGISERVTHAVAEAGVAAALVNTFDISIIVWVAWALSLTFLLHGSMQPVSRSDRFVAAGALLAFLVPIAPLSWMALAGMSIYLLRTSSRSSLLHRGAWVLLALTVPMFWSRLLFAAFSESILQADAALVGLLVGTPRLGNSIEFVDGSGYLWIAPSCSSLTNVSLAILCWVTVAAVTDRHGSLRDLRWVALACMAVVVINVTRISLLGLYPEHFDLIHGAIGTAVASWLILGTTVAICLLGVRGDFTQRASFPSKVIIRPSVGVGVSLLLVVTVLLKLPTNAPPKPATPELAVFPGEVTELLGEQGFEVREVTPADDLPWVYGTAEGCQVRVTKVAPQGWQRSLLTQLAGEQRLVFLFGGETYSEQPVLKTQADYYWSKLNHYFGRSIPELPVLAAIVTSACSDPPLQELANLSRR